MEIINATTLIPSDLKKEFTISAIANALTQLEDIICEMFEKFDKRLILSEKQASSITERIELASEKVKKCCEIKEAVKVISPAKYPAGLVTPQLRILIDFTASKSVTANKSAKSLPISFTDSDLKDKLHFYHVKVGTFLNVDERIYLEKALDEIENVGELLVFDSEQSPFFGCIAHTRTAVPNPSVKATSSTVCTTSPLSVLHYDLSSKRETEQYHYAPGRDKVPELDTPKDLPDLPGIRDFHSIEATENICFALSNVSLDEERKQQSLSRANIEEIEENNREIAIESRDVASPQSPPPPPPPLPPMHPVDNSLKSATQPTNHMKKNAESNPEKGDARSNLMAAIRQAGGAGKAKLRAASAVLNENNEVKPAATSDFLSDLHNKLTMRRKGISGTATAVDGASMLDRISSLIPEPQSGNEKTTDDDDWD